MRIILICIICYLPPKRKPDAGSARAWTDASQRDNALLSVAINACDTLTEGCKLTVAACNRRT